MLFLCEFLSMAMFRTFIQALYPHGTIGIHQSAFTDTETIFASFILISFFRFLNFLLLSRAVPKLATHQFIGTKYTGWAKKGLFLEVCNSRIC